MGKPRIYFDTKPLIDTIKFSLRGDIEEERRNDVWHTRQCMQAALDGVIEIITSTLTIAECKRAESEKPATEETKRLINSILTSGKVIILAQVTQNITERARDLDWVHGINLRSVDAVHVATAMETECRELFTGDDRMLRNASKFEVLGCVSYGLLKLSCCRQSTDREICWIHLLLNLIAKSHALGRASD